MNTINQRRHRGLMIGAVGIAVGLFVIAVIAIVGLNTLKKSRAGQAVGGDLKYNASLPYTPTGLIGVLDRNGMLASIVIVIVNPTGAGGSLIIAAPMADAASGTGEVFDPLDRVLAVKGIEAFANQAELMTRLSFDVVEVMTSERFATLVSPLAPFAVNLPIAIHDTQSKRQWPSGWLSADGPTAAAILTARDPEIDDTYYLPARSAVWTSIATAAGNGTANGASGSGAATPTSMDQLWGELVAGPVTGRTLVVHKVPSELAVENLDPALVDIKRPATVVVHDRSEMIAIFASIAPGRTGAPNAAARLRIIDPLPASEVQAVGNGWDVPTMWKLIIDGLLFSGTNVVSISEQPGVRVPDVTQVQVENGVVSDEERDTLTVIFGEFEAVPLKERIEGVDATVVLGRSFLDHLKTAKKPTPPVPSEATPTRSSSGGDPWTNLTGGSSSKSANSSTDNSTSSSSSTDASSVAGGSGTSSSSASNGSG